MHGVTPDVVLACQILVAGSVQLLTWEICCAMVLKVRVYICFPFDVCSSYMSLDLMYALKKKGIMILTAAVNTVSLLFNVCVQGEARCL